MSILTLKSINRDDPPEGIVLDASVRGITIYWQVVSAPTVTRQRRKKSKAQSSAVTWQLQRVGFHAVSSRGEDVPPRDADEQVRFVRAAYVLVACAHPISSAAEVGYEVYF